MAAPLVSHARVSFRASGLALLTLAQLGAVEAHQRLSPPDRRGEVFDRHMRVWVRTLLRLFGVKVLQHPSSVPPQRAKARLVVSNHRSPIDIALVLSIFGGQVLSRGDLSRWPILGTAARKAGTIFVDRDRSASGAQAIRQIRRCLQQGATITVFPEGTTFEGDEVRPFRMGAFVGAQRLDLEAVPVGIAYEKGAEFLDETFLEHLRRSAARPCTRVAICIGEPFRAEGRAADIGERLHEEVQALVHEARKRL
jgi:1-acyl-sn-glycerol-3-phosphate acyltransferase